MHNNIMWYKKPAETWEEGMPVGNGWLGGMILGKVEQEDISINLDTLWSGDGRDKNLYNNTHHLEQVRQLMKAGELEQAEEYISQHMVSDFGETYMPAANLHVCFEHDDPAQDKGDYSRALRLQEATVNIAYGEHSREIFCSHKDKVLAIKIEDQALSFQVGMSSLLNHRIHVNGDNRITLSGTAPTYIHRHKHTDHNPVYDNERMGMGFTIMLSIDTDGHIKRVNDRLQVEEATYAILYLTGDTDFDKEDKHLKEVFCEKVLAKISDMTYEQVKERHIEDYQTLYNRVSFDLGDMNSCREQGLSVDERLEYFHNKGQANDLIPLVFNFGRYLIIAGSRPGSKAMNLQGIWNNELQPVWQSNYTVNINTEMNYWPVEVCNLSECHEPLFDLLDVISKKGKVTAREHYGCRGWVAHHNVDIWGHTTPVGKGAGPGLVQAAFWPMSSGWLSSHLWEHYLYTEDERFLREKALPIMIEAAKFYLDWLVPEGDSLITIPATSPENRYLWGEKGMSISRSTTMDMGIIRQLFSSLVKALDKVQVNEDLKDELVNALIKLKPYTIGKEGQLMEWIDDYEDHDTVHRHVSHLFALYPSEDITTERTPDLAKACAATLNKRGDDGTGWSLAWKVLLWSRLKDGHRAYQLIKSYLKPITSTIKNYYHGGVYKSLLCAHPPYQIDGNCGITAAIAEMLIQSHNGYIELLPALPDDWKNGELKGVRARGNYTVDFSWSDGKVKQLQVHSHKKKCIVTLNGTKREYPCNQLIELK